MVYFFPFYWQFVKDRGNYVEEKKLKVILVSLPDSPTLSPINGNLNQGMGRETSFSKDQPLSGVEDQIRPHMVRETLTLLSQAPFLSC